MIKLDRILFRKANKKPPIIRGFKINLDKINKPNRPIAEPVVDSINKPVIPPVGNGQMSIGGVGGGNVQVAPQETEVESYIIGGIKQDVDKDSLKGFTL